MPRVTLRRSVFYLTAATAASLFILGVQQQQHQAWVPLGMPLNITLSSSEPHPWFMEDGELFPEIQQDSEQWLRKSLLWPDEDTGDRIVEQLMFRSPLPSPSEDHQDSDAVDTVSPPYKKILMYNGLAWGLTAGHEKFLEYKCPVDTCVLTANKSEVTSADAIMFKDRFRMPSHYRNARQVWVMFLLESPFNSQKFSTGSYFNWTATYRHDSDIVTPYGKWVYYNDKIKQKPQELNYAANKTKKVAWFVSNCGTRNNRLKYAKELGKYIAVDIYGACGTLRCPRSDKEKCFEMLNSDYKFYLSFENSNCRDYITEKFFNTGLRHRVLPIVMGAHPDDYRRSAPENSYIHVDDFESPKELSAYLHKLDNNDELYNEYFRWKGTGELINTFFICRLCAMLHDEDHQQHYKDMDLWWRGTGTCISQSWREYDKQKTEEEMDK